MQAPTLTAGPPHGPAPAPHPQHPPTVLGRGVRFVSLLALGLAAALAGHAWLNWDDPAYWGSTLNQWSIGLISGVVLGWGTRIRWSDLPTRLAIWLRLQRRRMWWTLWGLAALAILLFY